MQTSSQTSHSALSSIRNSLPGCQVYRHLDRDRQQVLVLVAVVDQVGKRHRLRVRPGDVGRHSALGQRPVQHGRQAGVTGVFPVGMPARIGQHAQTQLQRRAGLDAGGPGHQLDFDMVTLNRPGLRQQRTGQEQQNQGEQGSPAKTRHDASDLINSLSLRPEL
jgi:hypothetical protein